MECSEKDIGSKLSRLGLGSGRWLNCVDSKTGEAVYFFGKQDQLEVEKREKSYRKRKKLKKVGN